MVDYNQWSAHHSDEPPCFQKKRRKGQTKSNMSKPQSNDAQCILWFWVFDNNLKKQTNNNNNNNNKTGCHLCTPTAPPGGHSTNVYTGRLRPEVQPLTIFYTIFFHEKGTPFVYLLLKNGAPFTYLVYNFASLWTALSFKSESITKIERFRDFAKPYNSSVSPFGSFTDPNDRFPYPFIYFK